MLRHFASWAASLLQQLAQKQRRRRQRLMQLLPRKGPAAVAAAGQGSSSSRHGISQCHRHQHQRQQQHRQLHPEVLLMAQAPLQRSGGSAGPKRSSAGRRRSSGQQSSRWRMPCSGLCSGGSSSRTPRRERLSAWDAPCWIVRRARKPPSAATTSCPCCQRCAKVSAHCHSRWGNF